MCLYDSLFGKNKTAGSSCIDEPICHVCSVPYAFNLYEVISIAAKIDQETKWNVILIAYSFAVINILLLSSYLVKNIFAY